jgi:Protein of unknown function (DUF2897)
LFKAIIIILVAVGAIIGGLLTLRNSGRAGMPDADVLRRASKRAREQAGAEKDEDGGSPK